MIDMVIFHHFKQRQCPSQIILIIKLMSHDKQLKVVQYQFDFSNQCYPLLKNCLNSAFVLMHSFPQVILYFAFAIQQVGQ